MIKIIVKQIARMCVTIAVGLFTLVMSMFATMWWMAALGVFISILCFGTAYLCYRVARTAAELMDNNLIEDLISHKKSAELQLKMFNIILSKMKAGGVDESDFPRK